MKYPPVLFVGQTIFVCAPSNGLNKKNEILFKKACKMFKEKGFCLKFSKNLKNTKGFVSASAFERAKEFEAAWLDPKTNCLCAVAGGQFMMEILPHLNAKKLKNHKKLFVGFSDNTILCHFLLTHLDTCSLYAYNFYTFAYLNKHLSVNYAFKAITEFKSEFSSFNKRESKRIYTKTGKETQIEFETLSNWEVLAKGQNKEKEFCFKGRAVGGCIDVLLCYLGTKFDRTKKFLKKYKKQGFVWVFESCDIAPLEVKRALWQMKQNGWFKFVNGFVFGRPFNAQNVGDLSHKQAILEVLEEFDVPILFNADFGHVYPQIPLYLGAVVSFLVAEKEFKIKYDFV